MDDCLRWGRTWEVGVEVEAWGYRLLWACRPLVPDGAARPGRDWRPRVGACVSVCGLKGEEEQATGDLPEHLLGHEHVGPFLAGVVHGRSHG